VVALFVPCRLTSALMRVAATAFLAAGSPFGPDTDLNMSESARLWCSRTRPFATVPAWLRRGLPRRKRRHQPWHFAAPQNQRLSRTESGICPQFGPRNVFERGFQAGLKAGYGDGYSGRLFRRGYTSLYFGTLEDSRFTHFDDGFFSATTKASITAAQTNLPPLRSISFVGLHQFPDRKATWPSGRG